MAAIRASRRFLIPEVVQTSDMDCGPACLKCLLEGFGFAASYGRLREACQTDVDGTSIDALEAVAVRLGLDAEQIMVPADHVLIPAARALPAMAVVRLPNGVTHFVVAWRTHGPLVQVMDPSTGRVWMSRGRFLSELLAHVQPVSAAGWREWAGSEEFTGALVQRLRRVGLEPEAANRAIARALEDPGFAAIASLDAATRMVQALVASRALDHGREAARVLERLEGRGAQDGGAVPARYASVRPSSEDEDQLMFRGAVLLRVRGPATSGEEASEVRESVPAELAAVLEEPRARPYRELLRQLRADGWLAPSVAAALALAAGAVVFEALLFRGVFEIGRDLGLSGQRLQGVGMLLAFVAALMLLELPLAMALLRLGRGLEVRLRAAFLRKIPRLGDRYFRSRLISDMAERGHSLQRIRLLPDLAGQLLRACFELVLTVAGIAWLDPRSAPLALVVAAIAVGVPLAAQPALGERDLRVRSHAGALSRFYLDALLGLVPIRAHVAERAVRREHERLLVDWARAGVVLQRALVSVEAIGMFLGFGLVWLLVSHMTQRGDPGSVLLVTYWALHLPVLGEQIATLARQVPDHRNVALRLQEPLGAPEEDEVFAGNGAPAAAPPRPHVSPGRAVALELEGVTVRAGGHVILEGLDLVVSPGDHVGVVGHSGAGKSSLVGLLLGWHRASEGQVRVDGARLDGAALEALRRATAWVDPAVQLWNRSLHDNLRYGLPTDARPSIAPLIETVDLRGLLMTLPEGLQTRLGEGGALVSGGEGQRVRLGRAMLRSGVRLAILDEPFRGLDREQRRELLGRARALWRDATMICITHDVAETRAFDRVLVMERGRIVEDGPPETLAADPGSAYRALLEAERAAREKLWSQGSWRRISLDREGLRESLAIAATGPGESNGVER